MAKKQKSSTVVAQAPVSEVETLTAKNRQLGGWLVASLMLLRREFVRNLNHRQFETETGKEVLKALHEIEGKVPSIKCEKCSGTGLFFSGYSNVYSVCYDCICGRLIGKPGMQHAIDVKVSKTYRTDGRNNRFNRDAEQAPNWVVSEEEIAKYKAAKNGSGSNKLDADISF